ncbi:uncharacterized protein LOC119732143 [Patiria miniata]|uniref:EGF-like domain-containing protein n=1 Tax=Patiria miniata TaxID=46514 RepID=A0A914ADB3_PATMI|nr:uncharacterized protein LOC119732143 [Patiria miniata]
MFGACVVLLSVALMGVLGEHSQPFFDPDCFSSDCSWSWDTPTPGHQFCERIIYNNSLINVCPNPFDPPADQNERPAKAQEVVVTDFNKLFRSSEDPGKFEQYTCLNITYKILKNAADKVKGLQLSVLGTDQPDQNRNYCLNLNFTDQGLDFYAVEDRVFSMECFCGLKPGSQYLYTVRTLPVDPNPVDEDDTKVQDYHRPPNCDDPSKTDDVRCQRSIEARWSPDCFGADQLITSGEYDNLEVKFDVAPMNYNFDYYRIFIYEYVPNSPTLIGGPSKLWTEVDRDDAADGMCSQDIVSMLVHKFNISALVKSPDTEYIAKVQPRPSENQCLDAEGATTSCTTTNSLPFSLIADPCKRNLCGEAGQCRSQEASYSCECDQGYMEWSQTCVVDPCMVLAENGQDWLPRCENGECQYDHMSIQIDYYCNCNEGFDYLKTPKTCVANPCTDSEETGLTVCGAHGQCEKNLTDDQVSHKCICDEGYTFEDGECQEGMSVGIIIGIGIASCVVGLLLFVLAFCLYRHHRNQPGDPREFRPPGPGPRGQPDQYRYRRVLPIYSEDHPHHKEVIHCFCRFLKEHCKCDVRLMDWQKSVSPTVGMWLAAEIDKADIVLLICSKGTGKKFKDKARQKMTPSSDGVYGDVFIQALTLLDAYCSTDDACEKFLVCFFDYSSEEDIPMSFKRFGKYHLMKCMDSLFLRIHDKVKDSPSSSRRVKDLEEASYADLDMGKPLHDAIENMKEQIKREPKWYKKYNKGNGTTRETSLEYNNTSLSQQPLLNSLSPQISTDSAYDSTAAAQISDDFFRDTASSGCSSTGSDYEISLRKFQSVPVSDVAVVMPPHHDKDVDDPATRFFSDDIHLTMNPGPGDPFQSSDFYSDVQVGDDVTTRQARAQSSCV